MEEIISKVCARLVSNPHIIGIVNCDMNKNDNDSDIELDTRRVDLCIISREAGNQKTIYMEDGYVVCLTWKCENQFFELVKNEPPSENTKRILYDRTGLIKSTFLKQAV